MDDIMTHTDITRRDRYGRYLVVPPDGGKPTGYTRATTIAKTLDDTSSLMAWAERMVALGLSQRPDLLAQVHEARDDRKRLAAICEQAKTHGGATIRRDLGTSLHRILEQHWTTPGYEPPPAHSGDVDAVDRQLTSLGLEVVTDRCETVIVNDRHRIAGTFDLLLRNSAGQLVLGDIKTGSSVQYGALAFAIQLTIYATADAIYHQGTNPDGSLDIRESMPPVAQDHAYIVHVEPGSAKCEIHRLQLDPTLLELALAVYNSRKRRDLLTPAATPVDDGELRQQVAEWVSRDRELLAAHWPTDVPTPKQQATPYNATQRTAILGALRALRTATDAPWHPDDRTVQPKPTETSPKATEIAADPIKMPAEGPAAPKQSGEILRRYNTLDRTQQDWIDGIVTDARKAHLSISLMETPSTRRVAIAQTLVHAATHRWGETHLHAVYDATIDNPLAGLDIPLGQKIGALDYTQAKRLASLVTASAEVSTEPQPTQQTGEQNHG